MYGMSKLATKYRQRAAPSTIPLPFPTRLEKVKERKKGKKEIGGASSRQCFCSGSAFNYKQELLRLRCHASHDLIMQGVVTLRGCRFSDSTRQVSSLKMESIGNVPSFHPPRALLLVSWLSSQRLYGLARRFSSLYSHCRPRWTRSALLYTSHSMSSLLIRDLRMHHGICGGRNSHLLSRLAVSQQALRGCRTWNPFSSFFLHLSSSILQILRLTLRRIYLLYSYSVFLPPKQGFAWQQP